MYVGKEIGGGSLTLKCKSLFFFFFSQMGQLYVFKSLWSPFLSHLLSFQHDKGCFICHLWGHLHMAISVCTLCARWLSCLFPNAWSARAGGCLPEACSRFCIFQGPGCCPHDTSPLGQLCFLFTPGPGQADVTTKVWLSLGFLMTLVLPQGDRHVGGWFQSISHE